MYISAQHIGLKDEITPMNDWLCLFPSHHSYAVQVEEPEDWQDRLHRLVRRRWAVTQELYGRLMQHSVDEEVRASLLDLAIAIEDRLLDLRASDDEMGAIPLNEMESGIELIIEAAEGEPIASGVLVHQYEVDDRIEFYMAFMTPDQLQQYRSGLGTGMVH